MVTTSAVRHQSQAPHRILPEGAPSYGDMTTLEFLRFIAQIRGFQGAEIEQRVDHVISEVALESVRDQSIETI